MTLLEIFLVGIGLSMDAFAVSICKGLSMPAVNKKQALLIGAYFGVFQALMPLAGWLLGSQFARHVTKLAPWIAFVLLAWIGGSMLRESLSKKEEDEEVEPVELRHKELFLLAVAPAVSGPGHEIRQLVGPHRPHIVAVRRPSLPDHGPLDQRRQAVCHRIADHIQLPHMQAAPPQPAWGAALSLRSEAVAIR